MGVIPSIARLGRIAALRGPVLDVEFDEGPLPAVNEALRVDASSGPLVAEVQSHIDDRTVRAVALQPTSGLARNVGVMALGAPIAVPVGDKVLGRLLTPTGQVGDGGAPLGPDVPLRPIHRAPPPLDEQSAATAMFETGIKVIGWGRPCW